MTTMLSTAERDLPAGQSSAPGPRPSRAELYDIGRSLRESCPRGAHAVWEPPADRADPVGMMAESNTGRLPHLVPIRHGRMTRSPFAFYRGAALNMAADLAGTPATGLRVQACGDCHLLNFGAFATPERRLVFDINDLDETLPAPWEWDVKRLAASFVLACRNNALSEDQARDAVLACVRSYRERMAEFSEMRVLQVWYSTIDAEKLIPTIRDEQARGRLRRRLARARARSVVEDDFPRLAQEVGGVTRIRENPPLIYHLSDHADEEIAARIRATFASYRETLQADRRLLLDRYELTDIAIKVVGVGSVGMVCAVLLLLAIERDPLFLQAKQARASVLEPYAGESECPNHGERVVNGDRLMLSASDIVLGWTTGAEGRHFYIRQLKDMKVTPLVEGFTPSAMVQYAEFCGWALARAHARSGEPAKISGYLGQSDRFDRAIAAFAVAYADQSERDHEVLMQAVREGRLEVAIEPD